MKKLWILLISGLLMIGIAIKYVICGENYIWIPLFAGIMGVQIWLIIEGFLNFKVDNEKENYD